MYELRVESFCGLKQYHVHVKFSPLLCRLGNNKSLPYPLVDSPGTSTYFTYKRTAASGKVVNISYYEARV